MSTLPAHVDRTSLLQDVSSTPLECRYSREEIFHLASSSRGRRKTNPTVALVRVFVENVDLFRPVVTVPHWDIAILEGSPLEVFCVLNKDHDLGHDHNATDLRFYQNGTAVDPQFLTVVNETTLRYYVEKPTPMKAMLFCNLHPRGKDREIFVCLNMITVRRE